MVEEHIQGGPDGGRLGEFDGHGSAGPFRVPPAPEFVFFSESARVKLECLELNTREGIFVGPSKPRLSALAVVEALASENEPSDVHIIGRVLQKISRPYPLIRIRWMRAVSHLSPAEFLDAVERHYGFLLEVDLDSVSEDDYERGTEYDFSRGTMMPRDRDTARGDSSSGRRARTDVDSIKRLFLDTKNRSVRQQMGDTTTRVGLHIPKDD